MVKGLDPNGDPVDGLVNSIKVVDNQVQLQMDNGKALAMSNVTEIAPLTAA